MGRALNDYHVILNLAHRYAEALDAADFEGLGELFAEGEVHLYASHLGDPQFYRGRDAVRTFYTGRMQLYDGNPRTRHVITNSIVEISDAGGTAQVRSYFQIFQQTQDLPLQIILSGRYEDSYQKHQGEWRLLRKIIRSDYLGQILGHSQPPPSGKHLHLAR